MIILFMQIDEDLARNLLERYPVPDEVLDHIEKVKGRAINIAQDLISNGVDVDIDFVRAAALLHDIDRHEINYESGGNVDQALHATVGQKILEEEGYNDLARIAGAHSIIESNRKEARKIGINHPTKLPDRIEAKIICIADKLRGGEPERDVEEWFEEHWDRYFEERPKVGERIKEKTLEFFEELKDLGWNGKY